MNENQRPWTSDEKITVFAAVEQCRATGGRLDWRAIAATVPWAQRTSRANAVYKHTVVWSAFAHPPHPVSPPASVLRRPVLAVPPSFNSVDRKRNSICRSCNERQIAA